ncbi:MAG: formylmethanofuran--tetrahydromethanopterin N-formyltransferase [Candidatus Bathyarchaeota archaeon]|uniref:formylmethanofuran--tetrahydromethanopterin N-formyltransferase n=1 Tax=Candidatus Bathycorpusculum sp. TaxID=2994959 RepID=UPI002839C83F|nr:formylmethanofuran--tetrahydromethanopterin N-formyltransferase [Candidatus Termiticorpusculum sp.]
MGDLDKVAQKKRAPVIDNTFVEAFSGLFSRVIVTADDQETLMAAANDATATPSVVIGRTEGGVERYLSEKETPDGRVGAILQFWGELNEKKSFEKCLEKFEKELSFKIRQDILVKPFTAVFDALSNAEGKMDMMNRVGHCGDGYEWVEQRYGREVIVVPLMVPDFVIERYISYARGVMGGNFWVMCETKQALKEAGKKSLAAMHTVPGIVTSFDVCSAGSKPETSFPEIGPTTNHVYCPSLKAKLGKESLVPDGVNYIAELVFDGINVEVIKKALKAGIEAVLDIEGVTRISAGNYDGKLGQYKILFSELGLNEQ